MKNLSELLSRLFFSFDGTIGRAHYWLGFALLLMTDLVMTRIFEGSYNPSEIKHVWLFALSVLLLIGPNIALVAKRFRDLGWPVWWACVLEPVQYALAAVVALQMVPSEGTADTVVTMLAIGLLFGEIVVCGFLRGRSVQVQA